MTLLIPATPNRRPDAECIICYEVFDAANPGWTHLVNGVEANHDPMHERCIHQMFTEGQYRCPHDQILLKPDSLPARIQQLMTNFICAAFLGTGIAVTGVAITVAAEAEVAATVAGLTVAAIAVSELAPKICNDLEITQDDQIIICNGIKLGLLTTLAMLDYNVQTILTTMGLASGIFSGMITTMRW